MDQRQTFTERDLQLAYEEIEKAKLNDPLVNAFFTAIRGTDLGDTGKYVLLCKLLLWRHQAMQKQMIDGEMNSAVLREG